MKSQFYRPCQINDLDRDGYIDAIFHRFEKLSELQSYFGADGERHSAVVTRMIAIVECDDGQVYFVNPEEVRFMDGLAYRIANRYKGDDPDDG